MSRAHSGLVLLPRALASDGELLCVRAWLLLYLQHLRVGQILAVLSAQLLAQCLQLSAKQDDPFCGSLVAPAELPPRMPIVCTQRPAENTLEDKVGGTQGPHGATASAKGRQGLGEHVGGAAKLSWHTDRGWGGGARLGNVPPPTLHRLGEGGRLGNVPLPTLHKCVALVRPTFSSSLWP